MLAFYIVDGIAVLVIAAAVVRTVVRRRRDPHTDDWTEGQEPNITGNMMGITRR